MREDCERMGLLAPDAATARELYLGEGVAAPDLETVKDFVRFLASVSHGKTSELPTADSINAYGEWFLPVSPGSQEQRP